MAIKRIGSILGGLVFVSGLMAFFGIPGVIPAFMDWFRPELQDVVFCPPRDTSRCSDILLNSVPSEKILTANRLTLGADLALPAGMVIIANEIDLGGRILRAEDRLILIAREARNGVVRVSSPPQPRERGAKDGADGDHGGTLLAALGSLASTLRFDLSGADGANGRSGNGGERGRDGKCGAGDYRGAHPGRDGENGGNGGNGGAGGTLDLWVALGLTTSDQVQVTPGKAGTGGAGGSGGTGGAGCTGLGGSQPSEPNGQTGSAGAQGKEGRPGISNIIGSNLPAMIRFSKRIVKSPPVDFEGASQIMREEIYGGR